jgi:hypothetical protein
LGKVEILDMLHNGLLTCFYYDFDNLNYCLIQTTLLPIQSGIVRFQCMKRYCGLTFNECQ